jgi:hypothetical protein
MTASALPRTDAAPLGAPRAAGLLLLLQFVLMWTAFGVLATSIDWPQSLGDPASVALPRLLANSGAVALGYGACLLSALAMIPLAVLLRDTLGMTGTLGRLAVAFGTIAGLAEALGIIRWHVLMPGLAERYAAGDAADAGGRDGRLRGLQRPCGRHRRTDGRGAVQRSVDLHAGRGVAPSRSVAPTCWTPPPCGTWSRAPGPSTSARSPPIVAGRRSSRPCRRPC